MGARGLAPWKVAARWADPGYREKRELGTDPTPPRLALLARLTIWRSVLGMATLIAVSAATRPPLEVLEDEGWAKSTKSIAIALALVPALMIAVRVANRGRGTGLRWWPTVSRWLLMLATSFGLMTPIILVATDVIRLEGMAEWAKGTGGWVLLTGPPLIAFGVLLIAYGLWVAGYVLAVAAWAVRTSLWSGLFHPFLAPVTGGALVVITTVVQLVESDTKGLAHGVWLVLTLGGLVTTLALAAAEYATLRRMGVTWR